jgi:hypothetical protein
MAHIEKHIEALTGSQEAFEQLVKERLRQAVRVALISVLEEEVTAFIGAHPYERTQQRRDQRNGHYTRKLETTVGQLPDLPVPRTRHGYQTQLFERSHRRRDDTSHRHWRDVWRWSEYGKSRSSRRNAHWVNLKSPRRSHVSFIACRANMPSGNSARWSNDMPMLRLLGPTSR